MKDEMTLSGLETSTAPWVLHSGEAKGVVPLQRPQAPRLSEHSQALREIEISGIYSNYGPVNTRLEQELVQRVFKTGHCLTTCNATLGLMVAIRAVIGETPGRRKFALMPSFTFAATAHAALWCGLTPLLCDIDPTTWLPCAAHEEQLLQEYEGQIAVMVPYATFGNNLDLSRYERLSSRFHVPIVVDAAASLGSLDERGRAFGSGFPWPVIFSMHATKAFSVGEGGIVYSADASQIDCMRITGSFGFGSPRSATMPGLNSKLSEVAALAACLQLEHFETAVRHRERAALHYAAALGDVEVGLQEGIGLRQVRAFQPVLLPSGLASVRDEIIRGMQARGVGVAKYFSPHLAEQPLFQRSATFGSLPVTNDIATRILSLPLLPDMQHEEVLRVVQALCDTLARVTSVFCCT